MTRISTISQLSSIDIKSALAEKLALPKVGPGLSTYQVSALATKLQDWTDVVPDIYHSAIHMEQLVRDCFRFFMVGNESSLTT